MKIGYFWQSAGTKKMGCGRFDSLQFQEFWRKPYPVLITEKSLISKSYAFLTGIFKNEAAPHDFASLKSAEYGISIID